MNRIRQMTELMHATRKEVSMRRKLVAYWASMIFVLLAAMLVLASLFGVFSIRESNLRHALDAHHTSTCLLYTSHEIGIPSKQSMMGLR